MAGELYSTENFPGTIALTCGIFDLFHYGHLSFLQAVASEVDHLIVGMNSDYSVKRLKGKHRPIIPEFERRQMLLSLRFVSDVLVFDEDDFSQYILDLRPHYFAKSTEYRNKNLPEFEACNQVGTKIMLVSPDPYAEDLHTSTIIKRIMEREIQR